MADLEMLSPGYHKYSLNIHKKAIIPWYQWIRCTFRPSKRLTLHVFLKTYRHYLLVTFLYVTYPYSPFSCNEFTINFPSYSLIDAYLVTNSSILRDTITASRSVIVLFVLYLQVQDLHCNSLCISRPQEVTCTYATGPIPHWTKGLLIYVDYKHKRYIE